MKTALVFLECLGVYVTARLIQMIIRGRKHHAHLYWIFSEGFVPRMGFPSWTYIPWIVYGNNYPLKVKYSEFQKAGKDGYLQVSATKPYYTIFLADPQAIKEVARQRTRFMKDIEVYEQVCGQFGPHLVSAEGDAWKRQRKVNQKAFTERNIQFVWSETTNIMKELFKIWDREGEQVRISHATHITDKLALMAISSAAFGRRLSWSQEDTTPKGYKMSFEQAITIVSASPITRFMVPTWAEGLKKSWKLMGVAYAELMSHMKSMIAQRRTQGKNGTETKQLDVSFPATDNLFDILVTASDAEESTLRLKEEEITGNMFIFLIAGHETTAHALSFALGLLALYPDVQKEVYAHIKSIRGDHETIDYSNLGELKLVTGAFLEALRLYPVVTMLQKVAQEDAVLNVAKNGDENTREELFVPAGTTVYFSVVGTHYNPKYWPEPEKYRPSRFTEDYNKDAFLAFSTSHRSCIGRRFAETEATVALTMILARYEVLVDTKRFPCIPGECIEARQTRLLNPSNLGTIAPANLPLVLKRR